MHLHHVIIKIHIVGSVDKSVKICDTRVGDKKKA
jgi:hypothetical protein